MNNEDIPLTDDFYRNPLQFMQIYVRNLNNEIFLSEYHINNLYALLLIGRTAPWDTIKGNSLTMKEEIDHFVSQKVHDVKSTLESLSNLYEDRAKKSAINQIQKLMGILRSKKKSIYIEKDKTALNFKNFKLLHRIAKIQLQQKQKDEANKQQKNQPQTPNKLTQAEEKEPKTATMINQDQQNHSEKQKESMEIQIKPQIEELDQNNEKRQQIQQRKMQIQTDHHHHSQQTAPQHNEVFSIFYGLANLSNLSALALTNIIEYNSSQRFIKFKMSESYNMTIKSSDPFFFDRSSTVSVLPADLIVNHVFRFLNASQLFNVRSVCKQWLQHVKQAWHSTFKRQMFVQLLACQFCKDIQFYYKTVQLRNPFFQKLSLLIHALIQIIQWQNVYQSINSNTLSLQLKRILMIILRLTGEQIPFTNLNSINDQFFNQHKGKLLNLKERITQFFSSLSASDMSISDLRNIKTHFLDDPFMRIEQMNSEDKSPLLLTLFAKQMNLQQILRNHIFLCQQYLLNTKKRLDHISKKMVYQKGYLEGVYKILLLRSNIEPLAEDRQQSEMPQFHQMLQSIFMNKNSDKPDFVIRNKSKQTEIYLDNATKLDLILTTVYNLQEDKMHPTQNKSKKQDHIQQGPPQNQANHHCHKQSKNKISNSIDLKIQAKQQEQKKPESQ